ncbi:MAG TPA: phosphatidylglycerol lysyltransferase domain-containing protein, partial [Candidatus Omnitrophota bacterium]|nr:phosphatidylglycerol lysyltransferase domain-containing protein [Candidatus Omnitrophota bacterium]
MRELKPLSISDKYLFDSFLCVENHSLSAYSFSNLYIWKDLFDINFLLSGKTLYVFFTDTSGMFLQLPPLGSKPDAPELNDIWEMMLETNAAKDSPYATRIANIEEQDIPFYRDLGFKCAPMSSDYVSLRESLSSLSGNKFKAKRALVNHFEKNNTYEYSAFRPEHKDECLALYDFWMREKNDQKHSKIFFGMMQDNFIALNRLLENATDLGSI